MRLLDLYCGAGGAAMGYWRAGFEIVGVDIQKQPNFPFKFIQADALTFPLDGFDAIHASPPCQAYSMIGKRIWKNSAAHPDLIEPTRARLQAAGVPFVIENVEGAPLENALMLCGTMFGLRIRKHRWFELGGFAIDSVPKCTSKHEDVYNPWHGDGRKVRDFRIAQGTTWIPMNGGASRKTGRTGDVSNAIPPAYTKWLGRRLRLSLEQERL